MPNIQVLDQSTIDKIAAGEVIERPASVVKELLENAIDAKATAVTVEIKDGGTTFIRVTDNGCGIPKDQVALAFLRHSTSKIKSVEDLFVVSSLGFRGEALSSIAAVSQVELITKVSSGLTGTRYQIEGGKEKALEEIGAPEGTTFIARNLFYNTPARKKFLKSAMTEAAHVADLVEKIALSHPEISIRFIQNNQNKLHTSGNHNLKDIIYTVFGREIAGNLLPVEVKAESFSISGFIGKPVIARGNRNYENYYINGRYIKSSIIAKAIEEAYKPFMMQHKYPFTLLHFTIEPEFLDINVHPTKMELRFRDGEEIFRLVLEAIQGALSHRELIPEVGIGAGEKKDEREDGRPRERIPEPFERKRLASMGQSSADSRTAYRQEYPKPSLVRESSDNWIGPKTYYRPPVTAPAAAPESKDEKAPFNFLDELNGEAPQRGPSGQTPDQAESETAASRLADFRNRVAAQQESVTLPEIPAASKPTVTGAEHGAPHETQEAADHRSGPDSLDSPETRPVPADQQPEQLDLFEEKLLEPKAREKHKLIGQLFDTYWLVEYREQLYIIDQHAAHEKVLYEQTMASLKSREYTSQMINPPIILTLNMNEEVLLKDHLSYFTDIGFEIEHFGGKEYAVRAVPDNLFSIAKRELLMEMIDSLGEGGARSVDLIYERVASMSCKAAVKGNHSMSAMEANKLIDLLLDLENPYACPHGRPTIISMSKYELEKKFKRIV